MFVNEKYRPTESQLDAELRRKYGVAKDGVYTVRKGNAKPQEFNSYAEASKYLLANGGVLIYKVK